MSNVKKLATYTKEFKLQAIQLAEKNGSIRVTARELGISDKSLYS
jgi:transposase-like protein